MRTRTVWCVYHLGKLLSEHETPDEADREAERWQALTRRYGDRPLTLSVTPEQRRVYYVGTPMSSGDIPAICPLLARDDDDARARFAAEQGKRLTGASGTSWLHSGGIWWGDTARLYRSGESQPIDDRR